MIAPPDTPDAAEVQRLIAYGYALNRSRHFVLQVTHAAKARCFIEQLLAQGLITAASLDTARVQKLKDAGRCPANIGFTFRGLEELELRVPYRRVFQEKASAFVQGAPVRAAGRLADSGPSAAQCWDKRFGPDHAHVLLSVHADKEDELERFTAVLMRMPDAAGLRGWEEPFNGRHLGDDKDVRFEHFGNRDGISNPVIKGFPPHAPGRHKPGEFLLGYWNDENFNPWLLINPWSKPNPWLLPLNPAPKLTEFFRNGSFAAFRKIEQDVGGFNDFVDRWARLIGGGQDLDRWKLYVKAKLAGRWWNGEVVQPGQDDPPDPASAYPPTSKLNNFDFKNDPRALGCPFGAHIRRMNPRKDPIVPFRRRPLIRRGMPYGPKFEERPEAPRGLLGMYFCASLEDQLEHLLFEWGNANPMGPDNRGDAKDPMVGNPQDPRAFFDIPMPDEALRQLDGFRRHVTTRGTLYAFFPSLSAIGRIARCGDPAP